MRLIRHRLMCWLYRTMLFRLAPWLFTYVCQTGIGFYRKHDEIIWTWPWVRNRPDARFYFVVFETCLASLDECDALDRDYDLACIQSIRLPIVE